MMMRPAVEFEFFQRAPMQRLEQRRVLALHMGEKAAAAARMGGGHRERISAAPSAPTRR